MTNTENWSKQVIYIITNVYHTLITVGKQHLKDIQALWLD